MMTDINSNTHIDTQKQKQLKSLDMTKCKTLDDILKKIIQVGNICNTPSTPSVTKDDIMRALGFNNDK